jgi:aryl-alcohol dehydrogenase-like predicted oxidoreductase
VTRDFERDIIPMARHYGMALCPWNVLGGGELKSKVQLEARKQQGDSARFREQSEYAQQVSEALAKVAAEHGTDSVQQIALAYVMRKASNVFPLVGCRKQSHLEDKIKALSIRLTDSQVQYLESVKPFEVGFPLDFIGDDPRETGGYPMMELPVGRGCP